MSNHPLHKLKSFPEEFSETGFDLEPSDKVWVGIKSHLPKKKKRRVLVFWLLPLLFVLGGLVAGVLLSDSFQSHPGTQSITNSSSNDDLQSESLANSPLKSEITATKDLKTTMSGYVSEGYTPGEIVTKKKSKYSKKAIPSNFGKTAETNAINRFPSNAIAENQESGIASIENNRSENDITPISSRQANLQSGKSHVQVNLPLEVVKEIYPKSKKDLWMGFHLGMSPFDQNKRMLQNEPLSELIVGSYYNRWQNLGFDLYFPLKGKWSALLKPSLIRENLITDYDLSIPYDYNSEKHFGAYNENYFYHSLPTDQGNINTNLVVIRSSDSPVSHNELISLDFRSRQSLTYFSLPLGISYGNGRQNKGLTAAMTFVPEYLVHRGVDVDFIHSNHTFVSPKEVILSPDIARSKWHLGLGLQLEYRIPIYHDWSVQVLGNYHHYLTQTGRSQLYRMQLGLGKLF